MLLVLTLLGSGALARADDPGSGEPDGPFARGVVVSCPRYGEVWGTDAMRTAVDELQGLGVEWIQIHPYARIHRDGRVTHRPAEERDYLERAAAIVGDRGLQLFIKPHLAYWGSFSWRGAIEFSTPARWSRFFRDYQAFIVDQARFAERHGVPAFSVGTELEKTVRFEAEWREIISAVREVYSGHVTYAANWDGVDRVPFWDAVDSIGVQAYFPTGSRSSTPAQLQASWNAVLERLERWSKRWERPIALAEIGYTRSRDAAKQPWKAERDSSLEAIRMRTMLAEIALRSRDRADFIVGMFWWKWIPGWSWFQRDFSMRDPEMKALLAKHWGTPR